MNTLEYYPTPVQFVKPCVEALHGQAARLENVIDVACGAGEFASVWEQEHGGRIWKQDIINRLGWDDPLLLIGDFLTTMPTGGCKYDVIMMNPPFSMATEFILHAKLLLADDGVLGAFLSHGYLTGVDRSNRLWSWTPTDMLCFNRRIFFNGGCDRYGRMFVIWSKYQPPFTRFRFVNVPSSKITK